MSDHFINRHGSEFLFFSLLLLLFSVQIVFASASFIQYMLLPMLACFFIFSFRLSPIFTSLAYVATVWLLYVVYGFYSSLSGGLSIYPGYTHFVGFVHVLPFILLPLVVYRISLGTSLAFYFFYIAFVLSVSLFKSDVKTTAVVVRNLCLFFTAFVIGSYCLIPDEARKSFLYCVLGMLFIIVAFVFLDSFGVEFWTVWFDSAFVSALKNAATFDNGMISNKWSYNSGIMIYRLSSIFFEPHHFGQLSAFFSVLSWSFYESSRKNKLIFLALSVLFFLFCMLSFVKTAWMMLVVSYMTYFLLHKLYRPGRIKSVLFLLLYCFIGYFLVSAYMLLGIADTASTHLDAMLLSFQLNNFSEYLIGIGTVGSGYHAGVNAHESFSVLQSDSGLSTIVLSVGFIGLSGFFYLILLVVKQVGFAQKINRACSSVVLGWFSIIPFVSSGFSPVVVFPLFFTAGLCCRSWYVREN
ncbi:hypothetical protein [Motiliproteus sp.]|uniref:hypothetical protein n=1 Tax=Motiliproteus sp. TaxID=1898955 RepID=UPI003BAC4A17